MRAELLRSLLGNLDDIDGQSGATRAERKEQEGQGARGESNRGQGKTKDGHCESGID